ncbi:toxic anion resistance protein [Undibacterium cyanobacteriorum]|uniref:Toxic anion resistance protein n=1 Tax=Undibacterium cyanobacteriorum TaxID=3073561 RepID=A0ABY9RKF0_9BURK|nr:toxic anion resistance protein [Undibacterium sp. 20NA77.5]WMW81159.1 toxic anion resistance protein [Undibacterium sp. 20NA77.5]
MPQPINTSQPASDVLQAPDAFSPITTDKVEQVLPLAPQLRSAVEDQVEHFMQALLQEDLQSEDFKMKLDSAFALGREEIAIASSLMQSRLMQANFVGVEDGPAFKAIQDIRSQLDALNPGKEGDLLQPHKWLGIIPYGSKLTTYFRKYQSASTQLNKSMQQLYAARDDLQRDVIDIDSSRTKLWDAMQKLNAAIHFAKTLDTRLQEKLDQLQTIDKARAQALEQEVLFYARQNLQDMLTQQSVCTNAYLALDVLKRTGRELMNGCSRVANTGMSALVVAQTVARATGNQIKVMESLQSINATIENLITDTGRALNHHVESVNQFAQNPMIGIEKLKEMFDQTFQAMDAMDNFRSKANDVMRQNNQLLNEQLVRAEVYLDRHRHERNRVSYQRELADTAGPVAL